MTVLPLDGAAGHRLCALPLRGGRAAANGGLAVVEQVPFAPAVDFGVAPGFDPLRAERFEAHHWITAGPAVRYTRKGALASPLGDGSRAISVTGTRMPCPGILQEREGVRLQGLGHVSGSVRFG